MKKTNHTFQHYSVTLSWTDDKARTPFAFEIWDNKTDGNWYYREGTLSFDGLTLQDYDGSSSLPVNVARALHECGFGFAPFVLPDALFNS